MTTVRAKVSVDWRGTLHVLRGRLVGPTKKAKIAVGIFAGARRNVGNGESGQGEPIAPYAAAQEFGTKHIPPRPFLRNTVATCKGKWLVAIAGIAQRRGTSDLKTILNDIGDPMVRDVQHTMNQSVGIAPVTPKTVAAKERKGRPKPAHPLIDTEQLVHAIGFQVRDYE